MMSAEFLLGCLDAARELGIDVSETARGSGIPLEQLRTGEGYLPLHKVLMFLNGVQERFQCEHFGLLIARSQPPARFAMIGQLIRFAPTLGDAISDAIRFSLLNSEYAAWSFDLDDGVATLTRHTRVHYDAPLTQMQTLANALVHKAMSALCRRRIELRQVAFAHARPRDPAPVQAFFHAPVHYDMPFTGLVLPESELARPIPTADPDVRRLLTTHLEGFAVSEARDLGIVDRLRLQIRRTVGSRNCNLEGICQLWGTHPRGLQRALRERGTSFRDLLLEVRRELAEEYLLNSSIPVTELADILGYANASAFSRSFKKLTGLSPDHWRLRAGS